MLLANEFLQDGAHSIVNEVHKDYLSRMRAWAHEFVLVRLLAPQYASNLKPEQCAERFIFDDDVPEMLDQLVQAGALDTRVIDESLRLPDHVNFWIEFPMHYRNDVKGRLGFMFGKTVIDAGHEPESILVVIASSADRVRPIVPMAMMRLPSIPFDVNGDGVGLYFCLDKTPKQMTDEIVEEGRHFGRDFLDCLFMLSMPRAVQMIAGSIGPNKPSVAKRTGKPRVEFHRVQIKIGIPERRYARASSSGSTSSETGPVVGVRRLHRVLPSFRTLRRPGEQTRVIPVVPHWRGNPELGIVLHERHVKIDAKGILRS